jgi:hypothetical protein
MFKKNKMGTVPSCEVKSAVKLSNPLKDKYFQISMDLARPMENRIDYFSDWSTRPGEEVFREFIIYITLDEDILQSHLVKKGEKYTSEAIIYHKEEILVNISEEEIKRLYYDGAMVSPLPVTAFNHDKVILFGVERIETELLTRAIIKLEKS